MANKKGVIITASLILLLITLLSYAREEPIRASDMNTKDYTPMLLDEDTNAQIYQNGYEVCQVPDSDMYYGGIAGGRNTPPNGTHVDQNLTKYYNTPTAIGECGTYWYLPGWWFNQSEMMKLPPESITYNVSPYAIADGDGIVQMPIVPTPEVPGVILVTSGIFMIIVLYAYNKR